MTVQLRTAIASDLDAIRDVYRRSSLSNERDREQLLAHPDALEFEGEAIAEARTVVAVDGGAIVGFVTIGRVVDGAVELDDLFVDPERHRRGIGRALVAEGAARARGDGAVRIEVTANPEALDFYASVGFIEVGETETRFGPAPRLQREIHEADADRP